MDVRPQPVERGVGQVAKLASEPGSMRLDRLAQQPDGCRYRGKRARPSLEAKFAAHSLGAVVASFAVPIFREPARRPRHRGVACATHLAPELAALMPHPP